MKQKVLAIAGCIAATAPSASIADVLPDKLVGLNLGEIRSSSLLNQPFKGVIPFLFTSYESSKNLSIRLAPQSIFNKIGAEKHPILNKLSFQVTKQNNKPVILISSDTPINLPFLNFILEIRGPGTLVYQDYTVLLDPASTQQKSASNQDYNEVNTNTQIDALYRSYTREISSSLPKANNEQSLRKESTLLLASLSSEILSSTSRSLKYKVRGGDSLSKIAQKHKLDNASVKTVSKLIYQKNPKAFIRGNVNRLKKGVTLNLPSAAEINGFEIAQNKPIKIQTEKVAEKITKVVKNTKASAPKVKTKNTVSKAKSTYTVAKGDSLSKISKKFANKDISFSKMMNTIYSNNPTAFINKSKNRIKAGVTLEIPTVFDLSDQLEQAIVKKSDISSQKVKNTAISSKTKANVSEAKTVEITEAAVKIKPNQYKVVDGDTLSYITNKIGYKGVPFATMLNEIFLNNPDAFKDGKMTSLLAGSVITLPPLESMTKKSVKKPKLVTKTPIQKPVTETKSVKISPVNNNQVISPDLTKRIRELRKELHQAKESLTDLKSSLSNKEILLEQKNIQLNSLNTMLTKYDKSIDSKALAAKAIKTKVEKPANEINYKPKSKAEMAKIKRKQFERIEKTKKQIAKIEEIKNKSNAQTELLNNSDNAGLFKNYKISSVLENMNSNHAYLAMALLLGLLLIRYRRALYSYTYSKIKYDQPQYYPVPDADKYDLKEKNINYNDSIMDKDPISFVPTSVEEVTEEVAEVTIDSNLIDATEDIFEATEEEKQIAHCEHLVTELFGDMDDENNPEKNSDWDDIEKFCDSYIEKIKDAEVGFVENSDNAVVEEATDFNNMMTDLLESLDKVDKSVKRNNIMDEDFPDIVKSFEASPSQNHTRI